jgi:hypothetical protein
MPRLREVQTAIAQGILSRDAALAASHIVDDMIAATDRLRIYRNTYIGTLTGALRLTFPAVERLVGREFFEASAAAFIEGQPPRSAYLNEYGAAFGDFIAEFPPARSLPYLPDVARLEWAVSCAGCAPDTPALDPASLAKLDEVEQAGLRLLAHPSVRLLEVRYPVDRMWRAVLDRDDAALAGIDLKCRSRWLFVYRCEDGVMVRRLTEAEGRFTAALCAGRPLGEVMTPATTPDLVTLLAEHLAHGRFAGMAIAAAAAAAPPAHAEVPR